MAEPVVLVVTSSGAPPSAVVPVLAAIEAAGMRVRAIDVGAAGGGGTTVTDRVRRALLGEGAERKLRRELEVSPPDAAVVFDPYAAQALTVARDQVPQPAPVIAVVGELEPSASWAQTDADRFITVDDVAAVALADAGVEGERILVVGAIGERSFAEAGARNRAELRSRFKLSGKLALVEVAGLGAELTGQLALQLSLLDANEAITFLFDAAGDADAAAVLRRQVPTLGLRGKLFGATTDSALLWRAADVIVARPRPEVISRVMLLGGKLVALIDDQVPGGDKAVAALEARKRAVAARGLLMLASALDGAFAGTPPAGTEDGADHVADVVGAVAADRRAVIDERRLAAHSATRDRVRAASAAAQAAAAASAMPGELEDLGGGDSAPGGDAGESDIPDKAELERLRREVKQRVAELTKSMMAARDGATALSDKSKAAAARGASDEAAQLEHQADAERARMHGLLAELATLESELEELERAIAQVADLPPRPPPRAEAPAGDAPRAKSPPSSIDDQLEQLKRNAGSGSGSGSGRPSGAAPKQTAPRQGSGKTRASGSRPTTLDDELAALKKRMAQKKKP